MSVRGEISMAVRGDICVSVRGEFQWPPMGSFAWPPSVCNRSGTGLSDGSVDHVELHVPMSYPPVALSNLGP